MAPFPQLILISMLSLLPCVLWLWYFYSKSVYKRPPLRLIAGTFLLGSVSTVLALALNLLGQSLFVNAMGRSQLSHILVLFVVVGPVEELVKLLVVYVYAYRQPEFDEPLDGVIYATAAGLGFAAVENVIYLSQNSPLLVLPARAALKSGACALLFALGLEPEPGESPRRTSRASDCPSSRAGGWRRPCCTRPSIRCCSLCRRMSS